jgi:leucyl/phenylalanyl-tRNA--protein transferase
MHTAYELLHEQGWAHSIEVWAPAGLVGGLYGLSIGRVFFGESMFSKESNASKAAMLALCRVLLANNFALLDCQMESPHLMSLGATLLPRPRFAETLESACGESRTFTKWPVGALSMGELLGGRPRDALQ